MKKVVKKVVTEKKVKKPDVSEQIESLMALMEGLIRKTSEKPDVSAIPDLDSFMPSEPTGGTREIPMWTETVNDEWSRERMMSKIATLETRVDTMTQVLSVLRRRVGA